MSTITTANNGLNVDISWSAPSANGSSLTSYTIEFRKKDGSWASSTNCDTSTAVTSCSLAMTEFINDYNLVQGDLIAARGKAINAIGSSASYSTVNTSGAYV